MIPKVTWGPSRPRRFRSLKNSRQFDADSLSPACIPSTFLWLDCVTPIATRTGTSPTLPLTRILKLTPSTKIYLMDSEDRSRFLQCSMASVNSRFALLTSSWERLRPTSRFVSILSDRVLTPAKYMRLRSSRIRSSYWRLLGKTEFRNSPLRSRGTVTLTPPIPLMVK